MKKINIKQKVTDYIYNKKLSDIKVDFSISAAKSMKAFKGTQFKSSKITFNNYNKKIFTNAKFPLQLNIFNNKKDLKQSTKITNSKVIIINQFLINSQKTLKNFRMLALELFSNFHLITNKLNDFEKS